MSNLEQLSQDDIYAALKECLVRTGYMAVDLSEVDGWNPGHQAAWESFAYHKLGRHDYKTVPTSEAQLEAIAVHLQSLDAGAESSEDSEGDDSDSTSTKQPVVSNQEQSENLGTNTDSNSSDGSGSTNAPDSGASSEATDTDGEPDTDAEDDADFDENA